MTPAAPPIPRARPAEPNPYRRAPETAAALDAIAAAGGLWDAATCAAALGVTPGAFIDRLRYRSIRATVPEPALILPRRAKLLWTPADLEAAGLDGIR